MSRLPRMHFFRGLSSTVPAPSIRARAVEVSRRCDKFFVTDFRTVQRQVDAWKAHLGWIETYYAIKANNSDQLLKFLYQNNINFDVASAAEMRKCVKLGVDPSEMIYSNPMKIEADLREAKQLGIRLTVFDALTELQKIKRNQDDGAELLMRIKVEDHNAQVPFSHRFGAQKDEWLELFESVQNLGLTFRGVSFHVGSGIKGGRAAAYDNAVTLASDALQAAKNFGFSSANIINIGGGFGAEEDLEVMGSVLSRRRDELDGNKWLAEPGRYFAAQSQVAVTQVLLVKPASGKRKQQITVNDGIYGTFSCIPFDHSGLMQSDDFPVDLDGNLFSNVVPTQVFGPSCDGYDVISEDLPVPADIEVGDFLAFGGMGAYTQVSSSEFNGIPLSQELEADVT